MRAKCHGLGGADDEVLRAHHKRVASISAGRHSNRELAVLAEVIHDREGYGGFAAAGLANDPVRLPRHQLQVEVDHRGHLARAGAIGDREISAL